MESTIVDRPTFEWSDVAPLAARFGDFRHVKMLPSERDQNFLLEVADTTDRIVLKCHNPTDDQAFIDLQIQALDRAAAVGANCQQVLRAIDSGEAVLPHGLPDGTVSNCRALSFLPGEMLADSMALAAHDDDARDRLMASIGHAVGSVTQSLLGFEHPAAHREFQWDLLKCEQIISERLNDVDEAKRPLVEACLTKYQQDVKSLLPQLRRSIIHNDANDYNLVVMKDGQIGVLDFGDMCFTLTVADPAICMAYLLFHIPASASLVESVLPFVTAFHALCPFSEVEAEVLFDLAVMRVCTSVCISSCQSKLEPDNEYLLISAKPAWALLERLAMKSATSENAPSIFRTACGFTPAPQHVGRK